MNNYYITQLDPAFNLKKRKRSDNTKKHNSLLQVLNLLFPDSELKTSYSSSLQSGYGSTLEFQQNLNDLLEHYKGKRMDQLILSYIFKSLNINGKGLLDKSVSLKSIGDYYGIKTIIDLYPELKLSSFEEVEKKMAPIGLEGKFKRLYQMEGNEQQVICCFNEFNFINLMDRVKEICIYCYFNNSSGIGKIESLLIDSKINIRGFIMPKYSIDIKTLLNSKRYKLTGKFKFHMIYQLILKLNLIHQYDIAHNDLSEVNVLLTRSLIELLNIKEENEENINDIKKHLNPYNLKDIKEYEPIIIDFGKSMSLNMNFIKNIQVKRHSLIDKDDLIHLPLIKLCKPEHGFVLYRSILTIPTHHKQEFIQPIKLYDPKKEDIYSLGILIFRILTNLSPWGGVLEKQLKQIREIIEDPIEQYKHLKRDLKDNDCWLELLCFLLHPKPELRWNSREVVKYLKVNAKKLLEECMILSKARTKKRM